jgi:hypothetical protein
MSKDSYQLFSCDCFTVLTKIIEKILGDYCQKYDLINNDKESFKFEFTVFIFYLTMQKFTNIFNDGQKEDEILDNLHSVFYASLKTQRNISEIELGKICNTINERYRGYDTVSNDDNFLFNLSRRFLDNIDLYHKTNFAEDIRNVVRIGGFIELYAKATNDAILNLKQYHEI